MINRPFAVVIHMYYKTALLESKRSTYLQKKLLVQRVYTFCVFVLSLASSMQAPYTPKGNFLLREWLCSKPRPI